MVAAVRRSPIARAFTLVELIAVIVVLAILSAVAIPKYFDYATQAKSSTCRATLGAVRSGIANFYANSATAGSPAFPTLQQLQTSGTVMQEPVGVNPFNSSATIQAATWSATPPTTGAAGWNYDAAAGKFWANTTTQTATAAGSESTW